MKLLLAILLTLALATPAAAEAYAMEPLGRLPILDDNGVHHGFYLFRYGTVTLEPEETEVIFLSLAGCPSGVVESIFADYISALTVGDVGYEVGWGYPHAYNGYLPGTYLTLVNYSPWPMTVKVKLNVRCKQ